MATNKNALIRYRTIDKCLQNRQKKWTLDALIEACSEALYELEGKHSNVSKRTVQLDIQHMRSDRLGYHAPIVVYEKKYYTYSDPNYSITRIPISSSDLGVLSESVELLKQFKDFSLFNDLHGVIQKLEDKIHLEQDNSTAIIHMDKNEQLKGLQFLDRLYQAILQQLVVRLQYQSFKARASQQILFHAYILKEFNNRWFVIGRRNSNLELMTLALDRIETLDYDLKTDYKRIDFDPDSYYQHTYGVTVFSNRRPRQIVLKIDSNNAPYVLTKPFHHSQELLEKYEDGSILISVKLHFNREFQRLVLGFGAGIELISPVSCRKKIQDQLEQANMQYDAKE